MFFYKKKYIFLTEHFCREIDKFYQFLEKFYFKFISDTELPRSGMICFPEPCPDPDPAKSFGSDRTWIHNTDWQDT